MQDPERAAEPPVVQERPRLAEVAPLVWVRRQRRSRNGDAAGPPSPAHRPGGRDPLRPVGGTGVHRVAGRSHREAAGTWNRSSATSRTAWLVEAGDEGRQPRRGRFRGTAPVGAADRRPERVAPSRPIRTAPHDARPTRAITGPWPRAATIALPESVVGPFRNRSRSENCAPSGTTSSSSNRPACSGVTIAARTSHNRSVAASRNRLTSRVSRLTPGSSTCRSRSHRTAPSNRAFGPSPVVHARSSSQRTSSASASAKSR